MIGNLLKRAAPTHFATKYELGHDRAFHLLEARRGRGKSYTMAYWALKVARKKVPVVANFHFNHDWLARQLVKDKVFKSIDEALDWCAENIRFVNTWDEIMLSYDCLILLDEVNRLFDSQDRSKDEKAPKVVFEWLQLSRRNRITLVFAAQSMDWLTPRVRQLFDNLWRAKKELYPKGRLRGQIKQFWLYGADPWSKGLNAGVVRDADYKATIPFDAAIFRLYDTFERIQAIPNESSFARFYDIYEYQLANGIVPPPPAPRPRGLTHAEYEALWEDCHARVAEPVSAVREQVRPRVREVV
ncbi:zonular occludens toxin domain-containing protein [Deinococcus lacus]|uniref:Zonular occludens toxin domain-containing protein n=1 Tax=Deinococcus lacus TaxID=392561 RepID=A0ABW1YIY7_9DEIO